MKNLIENLKENQQDFEFYPTTKPMIERIYQDLIDYNANYSILDICCGNGNFFTKFAEIGDKVQICKKLAIEKSEILINQLPVDVCVVRTDFWENILIDKKVDVVFSNPPYSQFEGWAEKIILEANCKKIYLVIPERWKNSEIIANALKLRNATTSNLGSFDFLMRSERQGRRLKLLKSKLKNMAMEKTLLMFGLIKIFNLKKRKNLDKKKEIK